MKKLNRIKIVLAEKDISQTKLREMLKEKGAEKNSATVSRWCRNMQQPSLETLNILAETLEVNICDLIARKKNG